jgi:hypothetical protein
MKPSGRSQPRTPLASNAITPGAPGAALQRGVANRPCSTRRSADLHGLGLRACRLHCIERRSGAALNLRPLALAEVVVPALVVAASAWKQLDRAAVIAAAAADVQALAAQPVNRA